MAYNFEGWVGTKRLKKGPTFLSLFWDLNVKVRSSIISRLKLLRKKPELIREISHSEETEENVFGRIYYMVVHTE